MCVRLGCEEILLSSCACLCAADEDRSVVSELIEALPETPHKTPSRTPSMETARPSKRASGPGRGRSRVPEDKPTRKDPGLHSREELRKRKGSGPPVSSVLAFKTSMIVFFTPPL